MTTIHPIITILHHRNFDRDFIYVILQSLMKFMQNFFFFTTFLQDSTQNFTKMIRCFIYKDIQGVYIANDFISWSDLTDKNKDKDSSFEEFTK